MKKRQMETRARIAEGGALPAAANMQAMRHQMTKTLVRSWLMVAGILILALTLLIIFPDKREAVLDNAWQFFKEMIFVLPAVMLLIGLITVWVPREMVLKYLGKLQALRASLFRSLSVRCRLARCISLSRWQRR